MKNQTDTPLSEHTQQTTLDAASIAHSVLLAREALDFGADHLSHNITERLRAARVRALAVASNQKTSHATQSSHSNFNFGQWFNRLSGGLRGGIAAIAVTIAFLLTFGTTQSDLDRLSNKTNLATTPHSVMASIPEIQASRALVSNTATHAPIQTKAHTVELSTIDNIAYASAPNNSTDNLNPNDEQLDIFLHEKIPLQAYLNDDFNQYANHQMDRSNRASIEHNHSTQSK
jgi:hypothetical protein